MARIGSSTQLSGAVKPDAISVDSYEPLLFAKRVTDIPSNMQKRLDYGARTDDNPVYVGFGAKGLTEGAEGWLLYYLEYDGSNRLTKLTIAYGDWTTRTTATYE
jgi:hypothetical protein